MYSLSGPSGTGKSTSALEVAHTYEIEGIIDDGLFIVGGEKLAGVSAKFEKNAFTAVRRAIFYYDEHCAAVKQAIQESDVASILLIGTSKKMTNKIAERLELGNIDTYLEVADVRSEKEIRQAKFIRQTQGKHVMPIPHLQVEQNFFQRLIQKGRDIFLNKKKIGETTIVQPDFHQEMLEYPKSAYQQVLLEQLHGQEAIAKYEITQLETDTIPQVTIAIYVKAPIKYNIPEMVQQLQQQIAEAFILHFGIDPQSIDIMVKGIREG